MPLSKQDAIDTILQKVRKTKATIKLSEKGYDKPERYTFGSKNSNSRVFVPDVEAVYDDKQDIYTIESSVDKKNLSDSMLKWILFSSVAKQHNGNLYIVVEDKKEEVFQSLIENKQIIAKILPVGKKK